MRLKRPLQFHGRYPLLQQSWEPFMRNVRERVTLSFLSGIRKGLFAVFVESRKKVLPPRHDSSHFHHEWELMERELKQATNPTEQCSEEARNLSRNPTFRQRIDGSDQICSSVCLRERKREKRRGIRKEEEVPSFPHHALTFFWQIIFEEEIGNWLALFYAAMEWNASLSC